MIYNNKVNETFCVYNMRGYPLKNKEGSYEPEKGPRWVEQNIKLDVIIPYWQQVLEET